MSRLVHLISLSMALLVLDSTARADSLNRTTSGDDVTVDLTSPFSEIPPGRIIPFRVTIRNDRNTAGTWHFTFESSASGWGAGATILEQDCGVEASASRTFEILVPLPVSAMGRYGGLSLNVGLTGPGFPGPGQKDIYFARFYSGTSSYKGSGRSGETPFTVIGNEVLRPIGLGPLQSFYQDESEQFDGSEVDVATLPSDWRGYAGIGSFLLKDSEWLSLDAAQHQAVCDDVAMGGHLTLLASDTSDTAVAGLHLPGQEAKPGPYGFGTITLNPTATFPPTPNALNLALQDNPVRMAQAVDQGFSRWALRHNIGIIGVNSALILSFVVAFGTLIGPVNLFVFANGKNRLRLFWTTPLISIAASLALAAGILFTDGIGGTGRQMIVTFSLPHENREAIVQEQVCRSALLLATHWRSEQNYLITPISTRALDSAAASGNLRTDDSTRDLADAANVYHQSENEYSGNWFRSRSVSGQYLQAIRPSRSALTVTNPQDFASGQPPVVLSSFPQELTRVYLIDSHSKYWTCDHLAPGSTQTCLPTTPGDFERYWFVACADAGGKLAPMLREVRDRPGYFYATGIPLPADRLATLGEIDWKVTDGIVLGPWVASTLTGGKP